MCTYMYMCVCVYVTTINDERGPEFEGNKGDIYERLWNIYIYVYTCNYIIVSRIKEIILKGKWS